MFWGLYGNENTLIPCYCICNKVLPVDPVTWSRDQFQSSNMATWWEVQCNPTTAIYLLIYLKLTLEISNYTCPWEYGFDIFIKQWLCFKQGQFFFSFFSPVSCVLCMFVYSWAVSGFCLHMYGCSRVCVCACRWRPKVSVKNPPPTFFHLLSVKPRVRWYARLPS